MGHLRVMPVYRIRKAETEEENKKSCTLTIKYLNFLEYLGIICQNKLI